MDDNSMFTDDGTVETPQRIELSELSDEVRPLAKRYAEQEKGSLTETVRQALDAFVEDPEQGLKVFDDLDPRVLERVLKKKGITREELVNKFKPQSQSQDSIESQIEAYLQKTTTKSARATIESKLSELPEWIRELAKAEFTDLTEWRTLSPEKLEKMANDAISLARVKSWSFEKTARLNLGSQSLSGGNIGTKKENSLLDSTNDPFWKQFSN